MALPENAIRWRLRTNPTITDVVPEERIHPWPLFQGEQLPAIIYKIISDPPLGSLDGVSSLSHARIQLDVMADDWETARDLAKRVQNTLQGWGPETAEQVEVRSVRFHREEDGFSDMSEAPQSAEEIPTYRFSGDCHIWYREAVPA